MRSDRETDAGQVVLVERQTRPAADDQGAVLARLVEPVPDAGQRACDGQQQGRNPEQLEEEQSAPLEIGNALRKHRPGQARDVDVSRGIRRHDRLFAPLRSPTAH